MDHTDAMKVYTQHYFCLRQPHKVRCREGNDCNREQMVECSVPKMFGCERCMVRKRGGPNDGKVTFVGNGVYNCDQYLVTVC